MSLTTATHLNFHGEAREALTFYRSVFGGQLSITTYGDFGMPADVPDADKVVYGQVVGDDGFTVMAYDVPSEGSPATPGGTTKSASAAVTTSAPSTRRENGVTLTTDSFFLSVDGDSVDEVGALWATLADGATVVEPYGPSQWAPAFGMLTDRFGVTWILGVSGR